MPVPATLDGYMVSAGTMRVKKEPGKSVSWVFGKRGKEVGAVTATITPEGETSTRVAVDVDPLKEGMDNPKYADAQKVIKGVLKPVMEEQVNATLDGREFNDQVLIQAAVAFSMTNQKLVFRDMPGSDPKREKAEKARRERTMGRMRYEAAQERYSDAQRDAARPMVDVRPDRY